MTHVVLNINNKKKWDALRTILEAMGIDYTAKDAPEKISEQELELLRCAENDKENGRLTPYTSHRDILGSNGTGLDLKANRQNPAGI
ncbi:MAG: hypothetical protein ABI367_09395 [Mucilaginibacter sp.]